MNTEELIRAMSFDDRRPVPLGRVLPVALVGAAALAGTILLAVLGIRVDLGSAFMQINVLIKNTFPAILALAAFGAVLKLAQPGAHLGGWIFGLAVAPILVGLAMLGEMSAVPPAGWGAAATGETRAACLLFISLFSLPVLAATLWALRRGASTRPAASGALAGLLSGAAITTIYALHCPEDSPLFYGLWYVLAIALVTTVGAIVGSRVLRW